MPKLTHELDHFEHLSLINEIEALRFSIVVDIDLLSVKYLEKIYNIQCFYLSENELC